eukprot:4034842-Pyramimonas_sp.AAC.1
MLQDTLASRAPVCLITRTAPLKQSTVWGTENAVHQSCELYGMRDAGIITFQAVSRASFCKGTAHHRRNLCIRCYICGNVM